MNETGLWFMLSTLLPLVVYPLTLCLGFSILGLVLMLFRRRTVGAVLVLCGFSILFIAALPMTGNWLYGSLERQFATQPIDQFPKADVIVLLGGVLRLPLPPRTDFELTGTSNRIRYAALLYRAGRAQRILVSGGNVFDQNGVRGEAFYVKSFLSELGVPAEVVLTEERSRNTYQNAVETSRILVTEGWHSLLLVTSASHMPRAHAVFQSRGLEVIAAPTDFQVAAYSQPAILDWIPTAGGLGRTTAALHEYLGMWVYRLRGWIH